MARGLLQVAVDLAALVREEADYDSIRRSAVLDGWDVDALLRTTKLYKNMLEESVAGGDCRLKVYVYPPPSSLTASPKALLHDKLQYLEAMMAGKPLQCLFGMYGTELLFHRWFLDEAACNSPPEEADLFFVPSYFKCVEVLNYFDNFNLEGTEAASLFEQTVAFVEAGPWFQRRGGADHIFLFSWGRRWASQGFRV